MDNSRRNNVDIIIYDYYYRFTATEVISYSKVLKSVRLYDICIYAYILSIGAVKLYVPDFVYTLREAFRFREPLLAQFAHHKA